MRVSRFNQGITLMACILVLFMCPPPVGVLCGVAGVGWIFSEEHDDEA